MTILSAFNHFIEKISPIYDSGEARSIARIVFEDVFSITNFQSELSFSTENQQRLIEIETRLLTNEPIQYILGEADFFGLKFKVDKRVLIPRQETEELVAIAIEFLKNSFPNYATRIRASALDIGTGSGCIPIAIQKKIPSLYYWAIDKSGPALDLAAENDARHSNRVRFIKMDFLNTETWAEFPDFQLITSNPPYIPTAEKRLMPPRVLDFEPPEALFVDEDDPLIFYRAIATFAAQKLSPGGCLLVECNEFNAQEVGQIFDKIYPFNSIELIKDLSGKNRIVKAIK